jgi:hypothetical protein
MVSSSMKNDGPARKVLEGVPPLAWGQSGECTFVGSLVATLTVTDRPYDYATLMGVSGLAFRIRWFQSPDRLGCPSCAIGESPEEIEVIRRATGWPLREEWQKDGLAMPALAPDVIASIDAGRPVLVYDKQLNVAVVFGYEDGGATVLIRDYGDGKQVRRQPTHELAFMMIFLGEPNLPLSDFDAAHQGITLGVRHWQTLRAPEDPNVPGFAYGPAAFAAWRGVIDRYDSLDEDSRAFAFFLNWWCYDCLADARRHAGPFLRQVAPHFAAECRPFLERAAAGYEEVSRILDDAFRQKNAFLGPWTGREVADWTHEVRERERAILSEAERSDAEVIAELELALARCEPPEILAV